MSMFARLRHSLAARLLGVFLITGMAMLLVLTFVWGVALKHQWNVKIRPHLVQYIDYVHRDLGSPPDPQRAAALARTVPVDIYIQGPGIEYSTNGKWLDPSELEFRRERHQRDERWRRKRLTTATGLQFSINDYDDHTLMRTVNNGYSVYYELRHREQDMPPVESTARATTAVGHTARLGRLARSVLVGDPSPVAARARHPSRRRAHGLRRT